MSVGADSLMGHLDMSKLLDKETLERSRVKNVKVEYIYGEPKDQTSDVFYCDGYGHNLVAKVTYKDISINIYCDGEMRFIHNDITVRNNSQLEEAGIFTDSDVEKIDTNQWMDNPWFDAYLDYDKEDSKYALAAFMGEDHLDMVTGDINEAVKQATEWLIREAVV